MRTVALLPFLAILFGTAYPCCAEISIDNLRCEYRTEPLGIDVPRPRLSWWIESDRRGLRQMAYQVVVASSSELLATDEGDLWNSGKVASKAPVKAGKE